jgi:osmoprotectant transport system ATP-binding protein
MVTWGIYSNVGSGLAVRGRHQSFPKWNGKKAKKKLIATVANSKFRSNHSKDETSHFSNRNKNGFSGNPSSPSKQPALVGTSLPTPTITPNQPASLTGWASVVSLAAMERAAANSAVIEFRHVSYQVENRQELIQDVSFAVQRGETLVLLGRSGAGKTTALKLINRLLEPTEGQVLVEGRSTMEWDPIELRRHIGYVVQEIGLFPHFTVEQNISLVPRLEKWPKERIAARVRELLEMVELEPAKFAARYPHELSGGQRQRVGVARALAADPPILLMDEPFGALDPLTRGEVVTEFQDLEDRLQKTVVVVTHHVGEALALGTHIGVMDGGKLEGFYTRGEFLSASGPVTSAYVALLRMQERAEEEDL